VGTLISRRKKLLPIQSIPYVIILGVLFGTTLLASRLGAEQFEPSTYVGIRLAIASLGFILVYLFSKKRKFPRGVDLWRSGGILGIFGTAIPMTFLVTSLKYQSSGITSILITLGPAITVVMAHFYLADESLSRRKLTGVVIALSGALLIVFLGETGLPDVSETSSIGYILVFAAMISGSWATVYARRCMQDMNAVDVATVRMIVAALVVFPLSYIFYGFDLSRVDQSGYIALGWAALFGTFLGMLLSFYNIQRFGATASAMTAYVVPIVASIGGWLFMEEQITLGMLGGMTLIVIGIALINRRVKRVELEKTI
jgi:drug/metabolite transporter (DMT)-like permease